jgi:hypothetical protein
MSGESIKQSRRKGSGRQRARRLATVGVGGSALVLGIVIAASLALLSGNSEAATTYQCVGSQTTLFSNWNGYAVTNGGTQPSFSTDGQPYCLISISTYHWNGGNGEAPGQIGLLSEENRLGPWPASGSVGSPSEAYPEGVPDAAWTVTPGSSSQPVIINGTYVCDDSDPASWSQDATSGGQGFCKVVAQQAEPVTPTPPTNSTPPTNPAIPSAPNTPSTPVMPPEAPTSTTSTELPPGIDCRCGALSVKVERVSHGTSNDPAQAVLWVELKWALTCTGGSRFHHCVGNVKLNKPAGSRLLKMESVAQVMAIDPRTGKLRPREVTKPLNNPVTCEGHCAATPHTTSGMIRVGFVLNRSATSVLNDGVQFSVTTTCAARREVHQLDLEFKGPFGDLDRRLSILS